MKKILSELYYLHYFCAWRLFKDLLRSFLTLNGIFMSRQNKMALILLCTVVQQSYCCKQTCIVSQKRKKRKIMKDILLQFHLRCFLSMLYHIIWQVLIRLFKKHKKTIRQVSLFIFIVHHRACYNKECRCSNNEKR